jgi:hypothetical protein
MTELKLMAAAAIMEFSSSPKNRYRTLAASTLRERNKTTRRRDSDECCSWCVDSTILISRSRKYAGCDQQSSGAGGEVEMLLEMARVSSQEGFLELWTRGSSAMAAFF